MFNVECQSAKIMKCFIVTKFTKLNACYITNVGKERDNNEDSILLNDLLISESSMNEPKEFVFDGDRQLFIVADGMGGHEKGELASKMALNVFKENVQRVKEIEDIEYVIKTGKEELNRLVEADKENQGLGTTVAGMLFLNDKAYIFNCGDSRVYRLNGGFLEKITKDHSLVQNLVDNGDITEDEMRTHMQKNVLTSAIIGDLKDEMPEVFYKEINISDGQRFFLCTDGVWETMSIEEMEECFAEEDIKDIVECLFRKTLNSTAKDNLSMIVIEGNAR